MTPLSRTLSDIKWWWQRIHPPLNKIPGWQKANLAERNALGRGCTQDVHKAREAKREIVHADLAARLFPDRKQAGDGEADRNRLRESW